MNSHEGCNYAETRQSWLPTRLLDRSAVKNKQNSINIVEGTIRPQQLRYMTLSHCWGSGTFLKLTQANATKLKNSIIVSDLPKTFQDAVMVAAIWFQCEYLWIDSLCIIQDSTEDWRKESAAMRHVYKNAWLNIAATAAKNASQGLSLIGIICSCRVVLCQYTGKETCREGTFAFS